VVFVTFLVAGLTGAKKILDWSFNDQGSMDGSARPSVHNQSPKRVILSLFLPGLRDRSARFRRILR
jgi:hypothetical protein